MGRFACEAQLAGLAEAQLAVRLIVSAADATSRCDQSRLVAAAVVDDLATLTSAVGTLILAGEDDFLGDGIKLGNLFLGQAAEDCGGGFSVCSATLLRYVLAGGGQTHRIGTLFFNTFDGNVSIALGFANDGLTLQE